MRPPHWTSFEVDANQTLDVGGHRLAFHDTGGGGDVALLIMGFGMTGRQWHRQVASLRPHLRVVTYDHRGTGGSDRGPARFTIRDLAADALRLLDGLSVTRAHIVGISMGGMVAQELALAAPTRVRSLSLLATHAGGLRAVVPPDPGRRAIARIATAREEVQRLDGLARLLWPDPWVAGQDRATVHELLREKFSTPAPAATTRAQLRAILGHRTDDRLGALRNTPVTIVKPGQDALIDPRESDRLARLLPGASLVTLPDAGHGLVDQDAAALHRALVGAFSRA